jgi:WD40 repeat protein
LNNAAVIEIRPVRPTVAATFLTRGQVGQQRHAWATVGDYLRTNPDSVAAQVLSTPLALSLARSAYQHSKPTELVDPERFSSASDLRSHLIERVLVEAYPRDDQRSQARQWLSWSAHHMGTDRDLGWWQIPTWVPRWKLQLAMAGAAVLTSLISILVASTVLDALFPTHTVFDRGQWVRVEGLPGQRFVERFLLPLGVFLGLAVWWGPQLARRRTRGLSRPVRLSPRFPRPGEYAWLLGTASLTAMGLGISVGLLSGLGTVAWSALDRAVTDGLGAQIVDSGDLSAALQVVLAVGLAVGIPAGLVIGVFGIWSVPDEQAALTSPRSTYDEDRRARTAMSLVGGVAVGLSVGVVAGVLLAPTSGLAYGAAALVTVTLLGRLVFGYASTLRIAESILKAPRFVRLLEDALEREVLRQAGSVYQFRHAELQDHLALTFQQMHGIRPVASHARRSSGAGSLPRRRRGRLTATALGAMALVALTVATAPSIAAMLRPDHVTLANTPVENMAFSPDGSLLICSGDGKTVVWDLATERIRHTFRGQAVGSAKNLHSSYRAGDDFTFSRDGSMLATAEGPVVWWWDVTTGTNVHTLKLGAAVEVVGFSPDRKVLAAVDADAGTVTLWDAETGDNTGTIRAWRPSDLQDATVTVVFSPDGKTLATAGGASELTRVWQVPTAAWVRDLPGQSLGRPAFSPDGQILAVPTADGLVLYDASTYEFRASLSADGDAITFGPGNTLATGFYGAGGPDHRVNIGGRLSLWDLDTGIVTRTLDASPNKLLSDLTTFSADGGNVVTGWIESGWNLDTDLLVWDLTGTAEPRALGRGNRALRSMTFNPDGHTLATGWEDRRVRIWKMSAEQR